MLMVACVIIGCLRCVCGAFHVGYWMLEACVQCAVIICQDRELQHDNNICEGHGLWCDNNMYEGRGQEDQKIARSTEHDLCATAERHIDALDDQLYCGWLRPSTEQC